MKLKTKLFGFLSFARKFSRHKLALIAFIILLLEILAVIFLPMILDLQPYTIYRGSTRVAPNAEFILGTDVLGRDMFARLIYGGRNSFFVGFFSAFLNILVGLPLGLIAGYYRGHFETIIMRAADIFMSFPSMVLILVIVTIIGPSIWTVAIIIGLLGWTGPAKLIYGNVLSVREKEYVEASKVIGCSELRTILKYVLPNSIAPLWMSISVRVSGAIITESSLSYLGAGIQVPEASWGNIIQNAQDILVLRNNWWIWIPAGICLLVTVICINLTGEGIRDALDPKMKR